MRGFTLIEVMGVLIILGVISLIIVPIVMNISRENKKTLRDVQIQNIEEATRNFVAENILLFEQNKKIVISIGKLKELGYLEDFVLPDTDEEETNSKVIIIDNKNVSNEIAGGNITYTVCVDIECDLNGVIYYGE